MTTLVTVGNAVQRFDRLLDGVRSVIRLLSQPVIVQAGSTPFNCAGCEIVDVLPMERFGEIMAAADLVIMHAGAGSIIHAVQAGKVPVVMPRLRRFGEHIDDHQQELAAALAAQGRVVLIHDAAALGQAVNEALRKQRGISGRRASPKLIGLVEEVLARCAEECR